VTLTVEPGVTVKFNAGLGMRIDGCLVAWGTSVQPIVFTSNATTPGPGDWNYIQFTAESVDAVLDPSGAYVSGSVMEYCRVSYGGRSPYTASVFVQDSSQLIDHCLFHYSATDGFETTGSAAPWFWNNTFRANGANGLTIDVSSSTGPCPEVIDNSFADNSGSGLATSSSSSSQFRIENNLAEGNSQYGIGVSPFGNGVIQNNLVRRNLSGGISARGCWGYCLVSGNTVRQNGGFGMWAGRGATVTGNIITHNQGVGLSSCYATVTGNVVNDNENYGLSVSESVVSDNTIIGNGYQVTAPCAGASVSSCTFTHNSVVDNVAPGPGLTGGLMWNGSGPGYPTTNNNIFGNGGYALTNTTVVGSPDGDARGNYWGTTDPFTIFELIYDYYDDAGLSIINYDDYLSGPVTDAPLNRPVITPIVPDLYVEKNTPASISISGYKWDLVEPEEELTWSVSGGDPALFTVTLDPVAETLTITPQPDALGKSSVVLTLTDGEGLSFSQAVYINVVATPTLSEADVTPDAAAYASPFIYRVTYTDLDNDPPAYLRLYIDGSPCGDGEMHKVNGADNDYTNGCLYERQVNWCRLGLGSHTFYFEASDGLSGHEVRSPMSGEYPGPMVLNTFSLTLCTDPSGIGNVTGAGSYLEGTVVPVVATPSAGWAFSHWCGTAVADPNAASTTVTMDASKQALVNFVQTWFEDDDLAIQYSPDPPWTAINDPRASAGHYRRSSITGARADFAFTGTGVTWWVAKGPVMGKARVYLDGAGPLVVDLYSPRLKLVKLPKTGLTPGTHTLRIEVSGLKNTRSTGYMVTIDAFEVVP
jgi:parallel beta-helix repeat protein